MRSFIIAACLLASVSCAQAQVTFGPEASLIGTNYTGKYMGQQNNTKSIVSYRVGGVVDVPVCDHFSIQPAVMYVRNGYNFDGIVLRGTVHVNTLEVPVNVMYKIKMHSGDHFFVGLGPYIAYNMSGKYNQTDDASGTQAGSLNIGREPYDVLKTIDFGLGINAGYQLANGLFLRAFYQKGLLDLNPNDVVNAAVRSTNYGIGVGMLFGCHHKHHAKAAMKNK